MRSLLLYLLLVGVPVVGLATILHLGRGLTAPPRVGGAWAVQVDSAASPCPRLRAALHPRTLAIGQSGIHLDVAVGLEEPLRVRFVDDSLHTAAGPSGGDCAAGSLHLRARRLPDGRLLGTLAVSGCAACAPVSFLAERTTPAPSRAAAP